MSTQSSRFVVKALGVVTAAALVIPGAALAKGPGGNPGGKPGGGEEAAANSLSVPAAFVGAENPYGLTCDGTFTEPTGEPLTGYSVPGYFYVQGIHQWQASCVEGDQAEAGAKWGDNLKGDAKLKVGKPIRVEVGLFAGSLDGTALPDLTGFEVIKLEPAQLDRVSPYGTMASKASAEDPWQSNPVTPFPETRVWADGTHLKVFPVGSPDDPVVDEPARAEINSTGRVVYGYNLRVKATGDYVLQFTFPEVEITSADVGDVVAPSTVEHTITVVPSGGQGSGKGKNK